MFKRREFLGKGRGVMVSCRVHANVGKVFRVHTKESQLFLKFIAPSHVQWASDGERQTEGVSPLHLAQGQLTGWDLIALK